MQFKQNVDDKRQGIRFTFQIKVKVQIEEHDISFTGLTSDVSVTGLALDVSVSKRYLGMQCMISIIFHGKHSNLVIDSLKGIIVRVDEHVTAVNFIQPLEWFLLFPAYQGKMNQVMQRTDKGG
ncbi:PilZ domain-containing protein [Desulfogranum japonicum]|uniref:PilZ domain-containing protein n=1 Tax=Desulfogranum japonicum TaxID=231447 RepID=UPI00041F7651|nr:PilZ domain-containing protein [Desulfogranum japonicum]